MLDDLSFFDAEDIEGNQRGIAETVVGAVQHHVGVIGDDTCRLIAEVLRENIHQRLQPSDAILRECGMLDVGICEVLIGSRYVALGKQLSGCGGDEVECVHGGGSFWNVCPYLVGIF